MLTLFTTPPSIQGTPNPSSFCIKLECTLRLAGVSFTTTHVANPGVGPKGKVPFAEYKGERIGDSTLIIDRLEADGLISLDNHLSARDRALSHAMQRLLDERLYWVLVYSRWFEAENWPHVYKAFFAGMPFGMRSLVSGMARRGVWSNMRGHGIGLHTRDEIYALGHADLVALSDALGDQAFYFGSKPTLCDASVYAMVISIIGPDIDSPLKASALSLPNLVSHCERMGEIFARSGRQLAVAA
ncbi:MAG: glutathione S-transferase family protein [Parvibaculum sp.]|nr:glutathione S-transferase family protein [Parvibaculum sp.]|tara:strand:+ start:1492 stop:2220 length:729 start_codon:yes stop_codon:yes gene_type:complete